MNSFSYLEPVCCSMSSANCCFLTCIQISQEADQVVWYSLLFQNFPSQFIVIHTVKGFGIVNKAEIDVLLELSYFFNNPTDVVVCLLSPFSPWREKRCLCSFAKLTITHSQSLALGKGRHKSNPKDDVHSHLGMLDSVIERSANMTCCCCCCC